MIRSAHFSLRHSGTIRTRKWVCAIVAALLPELSLAAQTQPRRTSNCAAALCEEQAIYVTAIDTVLRDLEARGFSDVRPPRILRTIHLAPFRKGGSLSPAVDWLQDWDIGLLRRAWAGVTLADSATVVEPDGYTLKRGGVMIILAPVTWMGYDVARVRLAAYTHRINYGEEHYIFLQYAGERWQVVRMESGWQN